MKKGDGENHHPLARLDHHGHSGQPELDMACGSSRESFQQYQLHNLPIGLPMSTVRLTVSAQLRSPLGLDAMWAGAMESVWPGMEEQRVLVTTPAPLKHIEPGPLAMLASWAHGVRCSGGEVEVSASLRTPYTYRSGVLSALLGAPTPHNPLPHHAPPFHVQKHEDRKAVFAWVAERIELESLGQRAAFTKALSEALNNVFEHAETEHGCFVAASRFPDRITLAISDVGIGIPTHMRRRHGHELNDAQALGLAVEPGVTGTAAPGGTGRARLTPTNAGLGLFVMRQIAADSGGLFAVVSAGAGLRCGADRQVSSCSTLAPWKGTTVCVSYRSHHSDEATAAVMRAITAGTTTNRKQQPFGFQPLPAGGVRVCVEPTYRGVIEDKVAANRLREEVLLPAIERGEPVEINLEGGLIITHSCAHALIYEVVRRAGARATELIRVRARTRQIKDVLRMIGHTAHMDVSER